jgi:hypothetical protein
MNLPLYMTVNLSLLYTSRIIELMLFFLDAITEDIDQKLVGLSISGKARVQD